MQTLNIMITENDHVQGNDTAALTLIEYGDYECPYCGRAYPMVKSMQQIFGETLRFVFRNFPWSKIHPHAFLAAVATEAAGLQNKFWEMHDIIFENQRNLTENTLKEFAKQIGLATDMFQADIKRPELSRKVHSDFESGIRLAVNRTPTFFLNGKRYEGHLHEDQLQSFLQEELSELIKDNNTEPAISH